MRAFIETADGKDLSTLLVNEGLAIIRHGNTAVSDHPNGRSSGEISSDLIKAEVEARAHKRGAWGLAESSEDDGGQSELLEATDSEALVSRAGTRVKVRGRVARVGALPDGRMTFINFGGHGRDGFVGIVRARFLPRFAGTLSKRTQERARRKACASGRCDHPLSGRSADRARKPRTTAHRAGQRVDGIIGMPPARLLREPEGTPGNLVRYFLYPFAKFA